MTEQLIETKEQVALTVAIASLRKHRKIFLSVWLAVLGLSIAYAFLARPIYRAELVLAPVESDSDSGLLSSFGSQLGQFASIAGLNLGGNSDLQTNLALLESKEFTRSFIEENNLIPTLFEKDWDVATGDWKAGREKTMWDVLDYFDRKVRTVDYDSLAGIVRLKIDWYSGELASQWANDMGDQLNQMIRRRAIEEAEDSVRYLREELSKNSIVGVEQSIYRLIESQVSTIMLANVRKEYAFQVIDSAIPPADDAQLRPNRWLVVSLGLVLGFVFGGFAAVSIGAIRHAE